MAFALTRRATNLAMPLSLAAMDACWVFAVALMVQQVFLYGLGPYPTPNPLVLALLWLAGWWVAGLVLNSNLNTGVAQMLTMLAGFVVTVGLLLSLYPPTAEISTALWVARVAFTGVVCLGVWSLGSYRSTSSMDFSSAFRMFIVGLVATGASFLLASVFTGFKAGAYLSSVGTIPMWFVGASLVAMALGNRELVRQETGSAEARFWTPVLAACVLFVLLFSLLGGALSLQSIVDFVGGVISWTLFTVAFCLYMVFYIIFSIFNTDIPYFRRTPDPATEQQTPSLPDPLEQLRRDFNEMGTRQPAVDLQNTFTLVALVLVCVAVLVVLFLVSRRLRRAHEAHVKNLPEDRESFGSWALLKRQIVQWWRALMARLFSKRQTPQAASALDELAALRGNPEWSGTLSVRQIYTRLQATASRLGYPRAPQQTPLEYLDVLSRAMPHLRTDFAAITSAYLEARYSPMPASAPIVAAATNAWKHAEPHMTASVTTYRGSGA